MKKNKRNNQEKTRYDGIDGIFYNAYLDEIFTLEWGGGRWINIDNGVENGKVYDYESQNRKLKGIGITAFDKNIVRLGDL